MNESVQKWLDELTVAPPTAIQKLVLGYAGVSAWSRSSLRESFVEIFQIHDEALDAAVAAWLQERLMKLPPEKTPTLVWASHLQDLFSALAGLPLPQVARLLRARLRDFRSWLRPLRTDESLDPEAAYLAALAWADTNQQLEGLWQGLALRRAREPAYYADIGLLGLRKTRDERGQLPSKAPFLLLATLIDLADTGFSQKDWLLTTRALLGGYHYSMKTWVREFEPVLDARQDAERGPEWLKKVLPQLRATRPAEHHHSSPRKDQQPTTFTLQDCNWMVNEVKRVGPTALGERLVHFLNLQRSFANESRNPYFLVRTFNRLAEAARTHDPDWAISRAEEALAWDEENPRNWTVLARCLWARGIRTRPSGESGASETDFRDAVDTLWTARFRFPSNAHARTELGRLLHAAGDSTTADTVYREAQAEFPDNPWCFTGLADMLLRQSMETGSEPELDEARTLFQRAADLGNNYAQRRLRSIERMEVTALTSLAFDDTQEGEITELVQLPPQPVSEMRPAQRLGRALLLQWQARRAGSAEELKRLLAETEALLDLPDELTGVCQAAFVEARGFLMLARGRTADARTYFEQQLGDAGPRNPLGLRLGLTEARVRLGESLDDLDEVELAEWERRGGTILPLVLKVVRILESTASDDALRDLLLELYPRVRELAGMPPSELGEEDEPAETSDPARQPETPDVMLARLLLANAFSPAVIASCDDLRTPEALGRVRASLESHRDDIFALTEKLVLAA